MKNSYFLIFVLALSGIIAIGFGAAILFAPEAFYATYGIELGNDASQLNEIRASGGALLGIGLVIASGAIWSKLAFASAIVSVAVYSSYGLSRLLSIAIDGSPDSGLVAAAAFELVIGAVSLFALFRYREERA
ncbi:MAG: DUF4345 domain-containing protein [Rhodospirillales bacterium]|nr:DUF4345 domain-containing protein [Rhodospirillales bacterium]